MVVSLKILKVLVWEEILGLLSQAIYKYKAGIFLQFNP